ncbi:hypothetical protein ABFS83_09G060300 [Erythranthe nasuta]
MESEMDMESRYVLINVIGGGAYGKVYRACDRNTGRFVAIKHEFDGFTKSTIREINILQSLPPHPSIVGYNGFYVDKSNNVLVVMQYIEKDLKKFISGDTCFKTIREAKIVMKQILEGVRYLHDNGLMHRDLKPSNILISTSIYGYDQAKICDFGLSRTTTYDREGCYTPRVGTRWYKAPELLVGSDDNKTSNYWCAVDMWSVGCIMAELFIKDALFKGDSEIDQLIKIKNLMKSISASLSLKFTIAKLVRGSPHPGDLGVDLVERLLAFCPSQRITAQDALNHPWFYED